MKLIAELLAEVGVVLLPTESLQQGTHSALCSVALCFPTVCGICDIKAAFSVQKGPFAVSLIGSNEDEITLVKKVAWASR